VAQVNMVDKSVKYKFSAIKMQGYFRFQVQQVTSSNLDFPTGNIQTREKKILIRLAGKKNVEELRI
jgi:HAE1 family hydrophobic/amphiphilic exporter-1